MSLAKLREYIKRDSLVIPHCVNTKIAEHHHSFNVIQAHIFPALLVCCVNKFMDYEHIESVKYDVIYAISEIKEATEDKLYIQIWKYILTLIKEYEDYATDLELFETAQNLLILYDMIKDVKKDNVNE